MDDGLPKPKTALSPTAVNLRRLINTYYGGVMTRLADVLGVSQGSVRAYVTGVSQPHWTAYVRITNDLNKRANPPLEREITALDLLLPQVDSIFIAGEYVRPGSRAHAVLTAAFRALLEDDPDEHTFDGLRAADFDGRALLE